MMIKLPRNYSLPALIVVLLGFLALAFAYAVRTVIGLTMPIWEQELGWSRGDVSAIIALTLVFMAIVAPLSGYLLDKKGLRFTLLLGMVAVCVTCFVVALAESLWALFVGFGLMGGVGFGIVSTHIVAAAVARVFPKRVGFATGIATSGSTAGQFLIVPLIAGLLGLIDWRWGFIGLGVSVALIIPLIRFVPLERGANDNDLVPAKHEVVQATWLEETGSLLKSPVFHLLFWSYLICGYTTTGVIETHFLPYAQICGFAPLPSATAFSVLSIVNFLGLIIIGWLTDRINRPLLLGGIYLVRGLTFWLLLNVGTSYENLLLFAVIFGLVDYSTVPVTSSIVASHLGIRRMGFVMGLLTTGHQLGAALGAGLGGYFFDSTNAYNLVWSSSIILSVMAGFMALLIRDQKSAH